MNTINIKTGAIILLQIFLLFITATSFAHATNITVSSSRNPVSLDDSFHLIYEADSSVDADPDFTPVNQDFDVLSSSQSTNMRSINGNWSLKKTWDLSVIAKDIGTFTVPAINFGKDISPAIRITVTNSTSSNSGSTNSFSPKGQATVPAKLFLESSINKKSGWIQSQFIYTVRLFRTVSLVGATITEPVTNDPDAIIETISEDEYQSTRNGIRYNVFERKYAIFPQKSGLLKINPVTFEGRVQATQSRSIFDQFRMSGQLKRLRSKAKTVDIKAAPKQVNLQDWLPASNLTLVEDWSEDITDIKAGEPITRTVTIVAKGLTAVQLPDLSFDDIKNLKQYPDKAVVQNRPDSSGIIGLKQIKVALIPASAGSYTLPEIKLEWWNTRTNKKEVATLAETVLTVTGTVKENTYPTIPPAQNTQLQDTQLQKSQLPDAESTLTSPTLSTVTNNEPYWKWLSLFFAFAWLLTLVLFIRKPGSDRQQKKTSSRDNSASLRAATSRVNRYAKQDNAHETRISLIDWAQIFYDDRNITNLAQVSQRCSTPLAQTIKQLNQALYSSETSDWHGSDLVTAFKNEPSLKQTQTDSQTSALKPLYNR